MHPPPGTNTLQQLAGAVVLVVALADMFLTISRTRTRLAPGRLRVRSPCCG
jgi:hypothetical protein